MISIYRWEKESGKGHWLEPEGMEACLRAEPAAGDTLWLDLVDPSPEEEAAVFEKYYPLHPLTREDITKLRREPGVLPHFPKVEDFGNYLFVVVNPLRKAILEGVGNLAEGSPVAADRLTTQLSAVLTKQILITHHYEPVPAIGELRGFLDRHETQAQRGPDYLFHLILEATVDAYVPLLDHFNASLDHIEVQVIEDPTTRRLQTLLALKQEIINIRKTLVYEREVLARMSRGEFELIEDRERVYYRNVYDHLFRFTELIEGSREMVSDLMQTHLAAMANKLNEIMKLLTMISTTILPMTLISGIYGMNFKVLPETEWQFGYPMAIGMMLTAGLTALGLFRWNKWL